MNDLIKWVPETKSAQDWNSKNWTWSNNKYETWLIKIWYSQILWHENLSSHFKQKFFLFWPTFFWYCHILISQLTWKIFTCVTIHQTHIFYDPWRQHPSSDSKMVVWHPFWLMPIFINKQDLYGIQISQSKNHNMYSFILPTDIHPKFATAK